MDGPAVRPGEDRGDDQQKQACAQSHRPDAGRLCAAHDLNARDPLPRGDAQEADHAQMREHEQRQGQKAGGLIRQLIRTGEGSARSVPSSITNAQSMKRASTRRPKGAMLPGPDSGSPNSWPGQPASFCEVIGAILVGTALSELSYMPETFA